MQPHASSHDTILGGKKMTLIKIIFFIDAAIIWIHNSFVFLKKNYDIALIISIFSVIYLIGVVLVILYEKFSH